MAKIMQLVDPRMLERMTAPSNPLHRSINTLDQAMQNILQRTDLSDQEKVTQYNNVLQKYHDHLRLPTKNATAQAVDEHRDDVHQDILETVPKTMKPKAQSFLDRIARHPNMRWNDRGEFVFDGEVIRGSNIVDLVNDLLWHRKSFQPHGWQKFARALRQTNIPQDLVGNQQRWDWMHRESATSDAFSIAEEETSPVRSSRPRYRMPVRRRASTKKTKTSWNTDIKQETISIKKEINWET